MREERDYIFDEDDTFEIVQKYEDMLRQRKSFFFDVVDFEYIIDFYLNSDNAKQAAEAVRIASQIHPNSSEIQIRKAELLVINGNFKKALQLLQLLIKIESDSAEVHFLMGQSHLGLNEFEQAEKSFRQAISSFTEDRVDLLYRIASLYQEITEYNIAIRYLLYAFTIENNSLNINFELGYCFECIGEFDKSAEHYNLYLDINPFSTSVWYNLGIVYTRTGNFEKALEAYDYAIAIDPANSSAIHNKANTLATIGKYSEAIEELTELIKYEPENPRLYVSIGECYEKLCLYDKAINTYNRSLEIFPSYAEAYFGIGLVKLKTQQPNLALENINKAIAIEPENYDFWLGLARAKYEINRIDEAIDAYRQATLLNPDEPDAFIGMAETLLCKEAFADVEELYDEIAERFSETYPLKVICAAAMYLQNKPHIAIELLRGAKKIASSAIDEFFSIVSIINDDSFVSKVKLL
jgi:tetratricopeptide (TPR) repeat protein